MSESGWVSWSPGGDNEHLSSELRARVQRQWEEEHSARGRQVARVVVDMFESGEVVLYLQLPAGSPIDPGEGTPRWRRSLKPVTLWPDGSRAHAPRSADLGRHRSAASELLFGGARSGHYAPVSVMVGP
jgi:hypothetical protein